MNKYLSAVVLVATIVVAACSGGGSGTGAPPPVPGTTWAVTSFTASDTSPFVGSVVVITAAVTKDGAAAPDGTTVEISVGYGGNESDPQFGLGSIGTAVHRLASSGGTVTTSLVANTEGPYALTARVSTASDALTVTYRNRDPSNTLQIFQPLLPNRGSLSGGEQVILQGKGILAPAEVDFTVNGETYPAIIDSVVESQPLTADGSITIRTPYISNLTDEEQNQDWLSNVTVRIGLSTADEQEEILPGAFTFLAGPTGPQAALQEPFIYLVIPDHGQSAGGEQVTVLGRNFRATVTDADGNVTDRPMAVDTVTFGGIESVVLSVSEDGTQIVAQTPRWSNIPLDADQPVDIVVTTSFESHGPYTATLIGGFVYLADEPTPEITAIAPTGGPIDGGTVVTIFGHGFQAPAQVTFGVLECINVEVNDDQTLTDQDTIICVTPDYSQQIEEPPVAVDVVVRNILTGKVSAAVTYTYGDNLYISGNTPVEGGPGDNIVIYGSGFEAPLQVDFADIRLDVLSVSGTEILVRMPIDTPPSCTNVTGSFVVTLLESGLFADGGTFTYLGSTPQIFGIDPIFVQETLDGDGVNPFQVTITGDYFNSNLIVEVGGFRIANNDIDVLNVNTIDVNRIPTPNDFGITWDQSPCITDAGLQGIRRTATPVNVTVINLPGNCSDTLAGGLVYEPQEPVECEVAPVINVLPLTFEATPAGSCSSAQQLTIQNLGQGSLDVQLLTLLGPFYFDNVPISQSAGPLAPIDPFASNTDLNVYFCPTIDDGLVQPGQLIIVSNDANSPTTINLSGQEAFPVIGVAGTLPIACGAGNTCSADITVSNIGTGSLTWTATISGDAELTITAGASGGAPAGGSGAITVQLDASGAIAGETFNATVTIVAGEADEPNSPVAVDVTGTVS